MIEQPSSWLLVLTDSTYLITLIVRNVIIIMNVAYNSNHSELSDGK